MLHDDFKIQNMGGPKLKKFKGHYKLTLKDVKTGEVTKQVEGDNIVTSALPDLIERCNSLGCLNINQVLPIRDKWFGGCLLYQDPFPVDENEGIDPDDYFIKNNSVNPLIAHAGANFTSDIRDDPKRGMPNTYLQEKTPKSCTMAWQWGPTQGNGQISAVALTHVDVGDYGTGSNSNAFKNLQPFIYANTSSIGEMPIDVISSSDKRSWRIIGDLDGHTGFDVWIGNPDQQYVADGTRYRYAFTISYRRMAFSEAGLKDSNIPFQTGLKPVVNLNFYWGAYFGYSWDKKHRNLWMWCNNSDLPHYHANHIWGARTHFEWNAENQRWDTTTDYYDLYPNEDIIGYISGGSPIAHIPHQCKYLEGGGYQDIFYFPYFNENTRQTESRRKVKYNIQNQSDYSIVRVNSDVGSDYIPTVGTPNYMAGKTSDDLLATKSYVMNDGIGYKCSFAGSIYDANPWPKTLDPDSVATFCPGNPNYILIDKLVCTTKANLPGGAIMKTASVTMELEYTITEIEDN